MTRLVLVIAVGALAGCGWTVPDPIPYPADAPADVTVDAALDVPGEVAVDAALDAPADDGAPPVEVACTAGRTLCGGACIDLQTDADHCGRCGNACPRAPGMLRACSRGVCETPRCLADCPGAPAGGAGCGPPLGSNEACGSCEAGARACDVAAGYACHMVAAPEGREAFHCCRSLPTCGSACRPGDRCEIVHDSAQCCQP